MADGDTAVPLRPAQDYKRAHDGDAGPNTGGMGAYAPLPWAPAGLAAETLERVVGPALAELRRRGAPYQGLLYAGLCLTAAGIRVVEFNARFGDPERLGSNHVLGDFDCGRTSLNLWLTKHARQAAAAGSARTYVVVDSEQARVVGYHALAAAGVEREAATARVIRGMPRYPVPVVLLARLAVDVSVALLSLRAHAWANERPLVEVATAVAVFPGELLRAPRRFMERQARVARWTVMPRGGHFAPAEEPELMIEDLRAFFRGLR